MLRPVLFCLALAACNKPERGDAPVIPPDRLYLTVPDQALPSGEVGTPYDSVIQVSGGDPGYTFEEDDTLPGGLQLQTDGHVKGTPAQAGAFTFAVVVRDTVGRSKRALISLTVGLEPIILECGESASGRFTSDAIASSGYPDLGETGGVAWLAVQLPDALTTRIDLTFDNSAASTLWVERPNEVVGSWDLDDLYVPYTVDNSGAAVISIDAGTDPSLTGFQAQTLVPMVLVASGTGDWSVTADCSDGPVFTTLSQYPTERGTEFLYDFDVYGADNTGVRIWTDDPLPDWILWDEATGILSSTTGLAEEPGGFEFTINAETRDGRTRSERAIVGVYDVLDIPCGESVPLTVDEGYFDGEFYAYYDPRGFDVFRVDLEGQRPSQIDLVATGSDAHYLGLAEPEPDWLKFYGGADRVYVEGPATLAVSPRTYPATHHYADVGELYFSAASIGYDLSGIDVSVDCDFSPRPDLAAMPVFDALEAVDIQLDAIGGEPPYAWSAVGLPAGLTLQRDGRLVGTTSLTGSFPVTLTVLDRNDASGSESYSLLVGTEDACLGFRRVYCGESISNEFTRPFYSDNGSKDSTKTFCIIDDSDRSIGLELYSEDGQYRVDIADPGVDDPDDVVDTVRSTYVAFVDKEAIEGVSIDTFSWPDIDDYQNLPVFVTLRAYDPGEWTVRFVCTE